MNYVDLWAGNVRFGPIPFSGCHVVMARTALTMLNISNNSEQNASIKERLEMSEAVFPGVERLDEDDPLAFGRQAGIYLNDSCLVVLTRTIGVSALDGLLLGWVPWLQQ